MEELRQNTWSLNAWYEQDYAGNVDYSTESKSLKGWGTNAFGGLAQNNTVRYSSAVQVGSDTDWKFVYSDGDACGATKNDGTFWVWGRNANNQGLGIQATGYRSSPVQLPGTNWPVTAGKGTFASMHTAVIKTDGTLWTWGFNSNGRLGHNQANTSYNSPKQVGSDSTWSTVSLSYEATFATKSDGTAWSWGWNNNGTNGGILGQNNETQYSSPRQIGSDTTWSHIQVGGNGVLATKTDNTLWCWGSNTYGRLGLNQSSNNVFLSSPQQVGSDTDWDTGADKIRCSSRHNVGVIKTNGELWTWGRNDYGQLGHNNRIDRKTPVQVPGTWIQFSTRHDCCYGLKSDKSLWAWGRNHQGQLGQNNATHISSPTQVHGLPSSATFSVVQARKDGAICMEEN